MRRKMDSAPLNRTSLDAGRRRFIVRGGTIAVAALVPWLVTRKADAQAAEYDFYIGPQGRDENAGTQSQPWAISALNSKRSIYAGRKVGLLDGTYDLRSVYPTYPAAFDSAILTVASGTSAAPTLVSSVNPLGAVLDGGFVSVTQSPYPESSVIGCLSGGNVVIRGLKIVNAGYRAIMVARGAGYQILDCYVLNQVYRDPAGPKGANSCGISLLTGITGALVSNCRVEGSGAPSDNNRHACIQAFDTVDSVIEFCSLIGSPTGQNGIHFKNTGNKRNTVRNCYIDMSATQTARVGALWHGNTGTDGIERFHNNVIKAGVIFDSEGFANRLSVFNNTAVAIPDFSNVGWALRNGGVVDFYNNITYRSSSSYLGDVHLTSTSKLGVMDYNCYADSSPETLFSTQAGQNFKGIASFYAATGKDNPATSPVVNEPGFVSSGVEAAYYRLSSGSACKGSGRANGVSSGSPVDIGAWGATNFVGCSFGSQGVVPRSMPPEITGVS